MHRHGYKGRKFGRERDQRRALMKGLADSLIIHESIETTLPKAKELVPYTERLITKAKKGNLHTRRQVIARLHTLEAAHKLVDDVAPKLSGRTSGHLKIERTTIRRGDNTQMANVSFVDDLKKLTPKPASKPAEDKKPSKPATKHKPKSKSKSKSSAVSKPKAAAKKTGSKK